jgi:hypothetical protein
MPAFNVREKAQCKSSRLANRQRDTVSFKDRLSVAGITDEAIF